MKFSSQRKCAVKNIYPFGTIKISLNEFGGLPDGIVTDKIKIRT